MGLLSEMYRDVYRGGYTDEERKERLKGVDEFARQAVHRVLNTQDGRVLLEVLARNYHDRLSFVAGDPHETSFREGCRYVALKLKTLSEDPNVEIAEKAETGDEE